jgi:hypothetical protein
MVVVGVSFSIGRKFSRRNGQNRTQALCRPIHHSDFEVPGHPPYLPRPPSPFPQSDIVLSPTKAVSLFRSSRSAFHP